MNTLKALIIIAIIYALAGAVDAAGITDSTTFIAAIALGLALSANSRKDDRKS